MHIYFVNRYSKLDGPFDITDIHHQKIIRNGDVIIRETYEALCFLIVTSSINKWNRCKCIDTVKGHLKRDGNSLLFSFDGISKRFGDIQAVTELIQLFQSPPCHDFFDNALSILTYQCDFWDMRIFKDIHTLSPFDNSETFVDSPKGFVDNTSSIYMFEEYLSINSRNLFHEFIKKKIALRDIYREIKRKYPKEFKKALLLFINDHPHSTIYDKMIH